MGEVPKLVRVPASAEGLVTNVNNFPARAPPPTPRPPSIGWVRSVRFSQSSSGHATAKG